MRKFCSSFFKQLIIKKTINVSGIKKQELKRCLSTIDLLALGVGSTLGAGVYVVVGEVAKHITGPSVIFSFFIAAVASILSGVCYAEYGARVPFAGSAYIYSYVAVGEFMAFVIGWNLILEYVIGAASVARAWSSNFDGFVNKAISNYFSTHMPMNLPGLATYFDPFSIVICLVMTGLLSFGVHESAVVNKLLTLINLLVILYITVIGFINANFNYWRIEPMSNITQIIPPEIDIGTGGFAPFGFTGILAGAGTCFYSFVGFDIIATTGEEVKNPQRSLPISIILTLFICFVAYGMISCVITLLTPYYAIPDIAPFAFLLKHIGWNASVYIVSIGAVCALTSSLLGCMFPLPRILYAMASDGLIYPFFGYINSRFKTPLVATFISGVFSGIMASLFSLKELVDMMSIGTLLAYTLVSFSVLLLRGKNNPYIYDNPEESLALDYASDTSLKPRSLSTESIHLTFSQYVVYSFFPKTEHNSPTKITEFIYQINTYLLLFLLFILNVPLSKISEIYMMYSTTTFVISIVFIAIDAVICLVLSISLARLPQNQTQISFKVPGMPWIPVLSMLVNLHLMLKLSMGTWIRFVVWMIVGLFIYFTYGFWHSIQRLKEA